MSSANYSRAEALEQKQRRKLVVAGSSAGLLLLLVVGVVAVTTQSDENAGKQVHTTSKSVKMLCSSTDYQQVCESSISSSLNHTDTDDPKVLLKAAVNVTLDAVSRAFAHSALLRSNDSRVRAAIVDCQELYENSRYDLERTLDSIIDGGIENLPRRAPDLRSWLSAVLTFMETCKDGFPEGELRDRMENATTTAKQLTGNALAIIGEASSFLAMLDLDVPGVTSRRRRLLADHGIEKKADSLVADLGEDGVPSWVSEAHRRALFEGFKGQLKPNVTVAKDGSGDFTNITQALEKVPKKHAYRFVIYVKAGVYEEYVNMTKSMWNVTMYGDGPEKTVITGCRNFIDGVSTSRTATFMVSGDGFMALNMGFQNTAGPAKHQAVALRVYSDRSIFFNCRMDGYQDTLYAHAYRQYYRNCFIAGTIDFIFGDAAAVFQNCIMVVRRPLANQQNIVTAQGRIDAHEPTGFVIHHCKILPDAKLLSGAGAGATTPSYLARPWKEFSRTVFIETDIGGFIHPDGYMPWMGDFALGTLYYAEYNNIGKGANTTARVKWPGVRYLTGEEAGKYSVENFIQGDQWIPQTGVPVHFGSFFSKNTSAKN